MKHRLQALFRMILSIAVFSVTPAVWAQTQSKTKIRIATASPSLSYLPIYIAVKKGFSPSAASTSQDNDRLGHKLDLSPDRDAKGIADAAIIAAPLDLKGEEMGLKRLLHMGTILQIPQAGLAATEEKIKTKRSEVLEVLKASIEGLETLTPNAPRTARSSANGWRSTPAKA